MKKTKLTRSLLAACSIVALTAVMYGCTGDDGVPQTTHDQEVEDKEKAKAEAAELREQINALRTQLGLEPAENLSDSITDLQGQVNDLKQQIADRDKDIADADSKAMTAKGKAIFDVLDPLGNTTTAADSAISPAATVPTVTAVYGMPAGVAVTDTTAGVSQEEFVDGLATLLTGIDATANTAFTAAQAGKPARLPANNGFSGTMLTWEDTDRADTMVVYTDIAAPGGRLFSEVYGALAITSASGEDLEGAQTGVTGAAFDGRTGGLVAHEANAKATADATEDTLVRLSGAFKGAPGSYSCSSPSATTCTSTVNSNRSITFSDDWTFTANTGAMVSVEDGAYMLFGWWMRDNKISADLLDNVAVFYGAQGTDNTVTSADALTGTAKYEGGAAGKYAWRDRVADTAHGGHFTAKAELTATFTANTGGDTLSGTISDFQIGDDGMDPNWTVTLSEADIAASGAVERVTGNAANPFNVTWAVGSSKADAEGSWQAQLSSTGADRNDNLPTGVSGAFNAEFGEMGRMLGAFGANITNPNPPN